MSITKDYNSGAECTVKANNSLPTITTTASTCWWNSKNMVPLAVVLKNRSRTHKQNQMTWPQKSLRSISPHLSNQQQRKPPFCGKPTRKKKHDINDIYEKPTERYIYLDKNFYAVEKQKNITGS